MKELVGEFTKEDLQDLPNVISITRQVAGGWLGLGNSTAFKKVCASSNMGCLGVGIKGVGKTTTTSAQNTLCPPRKWYDQDVATLASTRKEDQDYLSNSDVLWCMLDLSRATEMALTNTLTVVCALLTEHQIKYRTKGGEVSIEGCNLSWLGAIDYTMFNLMLETPEWRGNFSDRILRYHHLVARQGPINVAIPQPKILWKSPKLEDVKLSDKKGFERVKDMLETQFTEERAEMWAMQLGKGCALLNNRTEVTPADWKYLMLHELNITIEWAAGSRETLTSALEIDTDGLELLSQTVKRKFEFPKGVPVGYVMDKYGVSDEEWMQDKVEELDESFLTVKRRGPLREWLMLPHKTIWRENMVPQMAFEQFCLSHGREYYKYNPEKIKAKPLERIQYSDAEFDASKVNPKDVEI